MVTYMKLRFEIMKCSKYKKYPCDPVGGVII